MLLSPTTLKIGSERYFLVVWSVGGNVITFPNMVVISASELPVYCLQRERLLWQRILEFSTRLLVKHTKSFLKPSGCR